MRCRLPDLEIGVLINVVFVICWRMHINHYFGQKSMLVMQGPDKAASFEMKPETYIDLFELPPQSTLLCFFFISLF
jgi:hypothetical protein